MSFISSFFRSWWRLLASIGFLSIFFILFQNFQTTKSSVACQVFLTENGVVKDHLSLGVLTSKGECLGQAIKHKNLSMPICGLNLSSSGGGSNSPVMAHVVFGDMTVGRSSEISNESFVAEFQCGNIQVKQVSTVSSPKGSQQTLSGGALEEDSDQSKFEEMALVPATQVSEEQLMLEGYSKFCPGCYTLMDRKIVTLGKESCHEIKIKERVSSDFGKSLLIESQSGFEYRCFRSK